MQRIAPITQGQTLYTVDLSGQITGPDPATGNPVTLSGNINALFLLNAGGQSVEFSADNSAALNAFTLSVLKSPLQLIKVHHGNCIHVGTPPLKQRFNHSG